MIYALTQLLKGRFAVANNSKVRPTLVLNLDSRSFMRDDDTQSWDRRVAHMSAFCSKAFWSAGEIPNFDDVAPFFEDENLDEVWIDTTGSEFVSNVYAMTDDQFVDWMLNS